MVLEAIDEEVMTSHKFINPFHAMVSFYTQKTKGFLMFSGGIEKDQWHEMC